MDLKNNLISFIVLYKMFIRKIYFNCNIIFYLFIIFKFEIINYIFDNPFTLGEGN